MVQVNTQVFGLLKDEDYHTIGLPPQPWRPKASTEGDNKMAFLKVKKLKQGATIPKRGTHGSVGYDMHAYTPDVDITINPGEWELIHTGIAMTPPPGYFIRILPRSGLALRNGVKTMAGVIDPDYTGDVSVMLYNGGNLPFTVEHDMRVGQAVLISYVTPNIIEVDALEETTRGRNGYGSTGH